MVDPSNVEETSRVVSELAASRDRLLAYGQGQAFASEGLVSPVALEVMLRENIALLLDIVEVLQAIQHNGDVQAGVSKATERVRLLLNAQTGLLVTVYNSAIARHERLKGQQVPEAGDEE